MFDMLKQVAQRATIAHLRAIIPVANLRKTTIYNTSKNLVNDDVYTKFCLILSICSQDIE